MNQTALMTVESALPEALRRGVDEFAWRTLVTSLYPGAKPESALMVLDYCKSRGLDPMKKPCHIVPMEVKVGSVYQWRDVVMPGIYEYRTTAHRTEQYLGHSEPVYGPDTQFKNLTVPEWCELTVWRWNPKANAKAPFPVRTYFREVVALKKNQQSQQWEPNARWSRAPIQMMTKCCEAAALREAFPEELGGTLTEEEMGGQRSTEIDVTAPPEQTPVAVERLRQLPEGLQDSIEKAFTLLGLSAAQRLQKLNEFLTSDGVQEELAQLLLDWARDEYAKKQGRERVRAGANSKKKPQTAPSVVATPSDASAGSDGGGEPSDARGTGPESAAAPSGDAASDTVQNGEVLFE